MRKKCQHCGKFIRIFPFEIAKEIKLGITIYGYGHNYCIKKFQEKIKNNMITYFSFGQNHAHAKRGITFDKDCIVAIEAPSHDKARDIMFKEFGKKWSFQYDTLPDMSFFPRGIIKLR